MDVLIFPSYWTGNYDQYVKTRKELEDNQMKQYNWEQGAPISCPLFFCSVFPQIRSLL